MSIQKADINVLELFRSEKLVKICAPMVRYSKLQFRNLVKLYNCDLVFTPMIMADSFCQSEKARKNEFTTNKLDIPVIVQFAANTVQDFAGAGHLISPYCNGIDLNCGCPQRWARELGIGCELLKKPELIYNIVHETRNHIAKPFTVSVKIRLYDDIKRTVEIVRQLEKCGVSFITVHGRTINQSVGEINTEALKLIKNSCNIPIVGNGGISCLERAMELQDETGRSSRKVSNIFIYSSFLGCDGVMVAKSILANPSLYSGTQRTPISCIQNWLDICFNSTLTSDTYQTELERTTRAIPEKPPNLTFQCFHHHLVFMLEKFLTRKQKQVFNNLKSFSSVLTYLENQFDLRPLLFSPEKFDAYMTLDQEYFQCENPYLNLKSSKLTTEGTPHCYNYESSEGKYFNSILNSAEYIGDIFD